MNIQNRNIILASKSPRRRELLENIGLKFSVKPADIDENLIDISGPGEMVMKLAEKKAGAVLKNSDEKCIIIASDTIVYMSGRILNKPSGDNDAFKMLRELSGNTHTVYSSMYIRDTYLNRTVSDYTATKVTFYDLTDDQINNYIKTGEPSDKAGAYGIQGYGSKFIKKIEGCFFSVMGFPVPLFSQELYKMGYTL